MKHFGKRVFLCLLFLFCLLLSLPVGAAENSCALPVYGGQLSLPDGFTLFTPDGDFGETQLALLKLTDIEEDALRSRMEEQNCLYYGISGDLTGEWSVCFYRDFLSRRLWNLSSLSERDLSLYPSYAALSPEEKEGALWQAENNLLFLTKREEKEDDDGVYYEASLSTVVGGYHLTFSYAERGTEELFAERLAALRASAASVSFGEIPSPVNPILYPILAAGLLLLTVTVACFIRRKRKHQTNKEAL